MRSKADICRAVLMNLGLSMPKRLKVLCSLPCCRRASTILRQQFGGIIGPRAAQAGCHFGGGRGRLLPADGPGRERYADSAARTSQAAVRTDTGPAWRATGQADR